MNGLGIINHTIEENSVARTILNLYDGISFLVGLSNSQIAYYHYTCTGSVSHTKKMKTLYHVGDAHTVINEVSTVNRHIVKKTTKIKKLICLDYNRKIVASGGCDGSVCIFYLSQAMVTQNYIPSILTSEVESICHVSYRKEEGNTSEKHIFAYICGKELFLYDLSSRSYVSRLLIGKNSTSDRACMDRLNDNYLILSDSSSNFISIYDTYENKIIKRSECSLYNIKNVIYMGDGKTVVVISANSVGISIDIYLLVH